MAVKLEDKVNVEAPSTAFPYGNIKDNSGANDGTPVDKAVYADMHQFFERLMDVAGVTHNDLPESETNTFQYITALQSMIGDTMTEVYEASWDMNADASKDISIPAAPSGYEFFSIGSVTIRTNVLYPEIHSFSTNYDTAGTSLIPSGRYYYSGASGFLTALRSADSFFVTNADFAAATLYVSVIFKRV